MCLRGYRRNTIDIRAEIYETENRKSMENANKSMSWFFKRIYKMDKPPTWLNTKTREKTELLLL